MAEITAAERMMAACYNAGDIPRMLSVMTDEVATLLLDDLADDGFDLALAEPSALNEDEMIAPFPLRGARALSDGRVGAIVDWGRGSQPGTVDECNFHIYGQVAGEWRLAGEIPLLN
jgi:hypothetical protein